MRIDGETPLTGWKYLSLGGGRGRAPFREGKTSLGGGGGGGIPVLQIAVGHLI